MHLTMTPPLTWFPRPLFGHPPPPAWRTGERREGRKVHLAGVTAEWCLARGPRAGHACVWLRGPETCLWCRESLLVEGCWVAAAGPIAAWAA